MKFSLIDSATRVTLIAARAIFAIALCAGAPAFAGQITQLYSFQNDADGAHPATDRIFDAAGKLYGVTRQGGGANKGTLFVLTPPVPPATQWTKATIHSFAGADGEWPGPNLLVDNSRALYGVTARGGAHDAGTIFKAAPPVPPATSWTVATLYSFPAGSGPGGPLLFDSGGGLVGYTGARAGDPGAIFRLTPPGAGATQWTYATLYRFRGGADGVEPSALLSDGAGGYFGATASGGAWNFGQVFRLAPPVAPSGSWIKRPIMHFSSREGGGRSGGLVADSRGALYGVTRWVTATSSLDPPVVHYSPRVVFKLTPPVPPATQWRREILRRFEDPDSTMPRALLLDGATGHVYGVASNLRDPDAGVVFKLSPPAAPATQWSYSVVHQFGAGTELKTPSSLFLIDSADGLFGTSARGGAADKGAVFRLAQ